VDASLDDLEDVVTRLHDVDDTTSLARLIAINDLITARISAAIERVDRSGAVAADGALTTAHWLRTRAGRTGGDAGTLVKRATRLRACPEITTAWTDGHLSSGQVDVIVHHVTDRTEPILVAHAPHLVPALMGLSVRDTDTVMRKWAARAEALVDGPAPVDHDRSVYLSPGWHGGGELSGHLDGAAFQIVATAPRRRHHHRRRRRTGPPPLATPRRRPRGRLPSLPRPRRHRHHDPPPSPRPSRRHPGRARTRGGTQRRRASRRPQHRPVVAV
jgi:hypothetical protein